MANMAEPVPFEERLRNILGIVESQASENSGRIAALELMFEDLTALAAKLGNQIPEGLYSYLLATRARLLNIERTDQRLLITLRGMVDGDPMGAEVVDLFSRQLMKDLNGSNDNG